MMRDDEMANTNGTANLDDESLAMLIDEVSAMAESGRPLIAGLADLDDKSMGKLGRAANSVRASLAQGNSAAASLSALSQKYKAPIRVAMEVMATTGSTEPIHEAVRLIRDANEQRQQVRLAAINPILNVIFAAAIAFFVLPWILVSISEAELIKEEFSPTIVEICQTFAKDFVLAGAVTLAVVGLFAGLFYWAFLNASRGHNRFRDQSTFCRWLAIQVSPSKPSDSSGNTDLGSVMETPAEVVGPTFAKSWESVIQNVRGVSQSVGSLAMPADTPEPVGQCIFDLVSGQRESASVAFDLRRLSDLYAQKSHRRQALWTELLPRSVMWLLMIVLLIVMIRAILAPLLDVVGGVAR